jgi:hypothetical protein
MSNGSPTVIRAEIEKALAKSGRCKLTDFKMDGNSKTETMVCGADTVHTETTFHGGTASIRPLPRPGKASCQWPTSRAGGQETVRQANKQEEDGEFRLPGSKTERAGRQDFEAKFGWLQGIAQQLEEENF